MFCPLFRQVLVQAFHFAQSLTKSAVSSTTLLLINHLSSKWHCRWIFVYNFVITAAELVDHLSDVEFIRDAGYCFALLPLFLLVLSLLC